ncbi:hypothetical protein EYF80_011965 [Liparis tanakae]|uniref:Uncharacterized protein n=1 Tax=Liparis tanakae TaxID=230148 RepID=A0A4Z2IIP3_9TELE|nr:hypothetical protein EYF80_011965 [Liparis tanakae]
MLEFKYERERDTYVKQKKRVVDPTRNVVAADTGTYRLGRNGRGGAEAGTPTPPPTPPPLKPGIRETEWGGRRRERQAAIGIPELARRPSGGMSSQSETSRHKLELCVILRHSQGQAGVRDGWCSDLIDADVCETHFIGERVEALSQTPHPCLSGAPAQLALLPPLPPPQSEVQSPSPEKAFPVSDVFWYEVLDEDAGLCLENHQRVLVLKVVVVLPAIEPGSGRGQKAKSISRRNLRSWPRRCDGEVHMSSEEEMRALRNHSQRGRASQPQDQGLSLRRRNWMPWVTESPAVDLPDTVIVDKEAVQVDQASEHILREGTDAVSMQEEVEELQTVEFVEEVMGESCQLAAMHMQALQLLQATEGSTFQVM